MTVAATAASATLPMVEPRKPRSGSGAVVSSVGGTPRESSPMVIGMLPRVGGPPSGTPVMSCSAASSSSADWKRSSGSLAIKRLTTSPTAGGTPGRLSRTEGTGALRCW